MCRPHTSATDCVNCERGSAARGTSDDACADPALGELLDEVAPGVEVAPGSAALVVPLQLRAGGTVLSFISTTAVFGTPREVTLSELAIEAFYPADEATRKVLNGS